MIDPLPTLTSHSHSHHIHSKNSPKKSKLKRAKTIYENRYESFADERFGCHAKLLINGKKYFEDLFESLTKAKRSIYISGWALSPELFLIRPVNLEINHETRLMDVLCAKAKENVVIKLLIYKEVPFTLPLDSLHTKTVLNSLHPNIKVRRHPRNNFPYNLYAHHEKLVIIDEEIAYIGGIDLFWGRYETEKYSIKEESNDKKLYYWPGIEYSNDRKVDRLDLKNYLEEYLDRDKTQRMPWHDMTVRLEGPVVIDAFRHFFQRWCHAIDGVNRHPISFDDYIYSLDEKLLKNKFNRGKISCQMVRSASKWSAGNPLTESSIHNAYIDLIANSKYYIMINNQFIISNSYSEESNKHLSSKVINDVAFHIVRRIERAYKNQEKFRVLIFLPLLPAFAGKVKETQAVRTILKYTYRTISKHKGLSMIEQLIELMGDKYQNYIYFLSLRSHGTIHGVPKTELIYVHAKTMIVDDEAVIIGSANLNDRSLAGERDSETAVVIKPGDDKIDSVINGQSVSVGKFAFEMRVELLRQYLGIDVEDNKTLSLLVDPLSDDLYNFILNRAKKNTLLYREIFKCIPDDIFQTMQDLIYSTRDNCSKCLEIIKEKYDRLKDDIIGFIVEFPINFLKKENLSRNVFTKEKIITINLFL